MHEKFAKISEQIDAATSGMSEEELNFHPEGKWASAQILEHLALAFGGTARVFEKCLAEGKLLGGAPTFKQRVQNMVVLEMGYLPGGRTAPTGVTPKGEIGGKEALGLIRANLAKMDAALAQCEEKLGDRSGCLADHPVLGPLTATQWPKFHLTHTRHHMKQVVLLRAAAKRQGIR